MTYVIMRVSPQAHAEIKAKLLAAAYHHAIDERGNLMMHGIALELDPNQEVPTPRRLAYEANKDNRYKHGIYARILYEGGMHKFKIHREGHEAGIIVWSDREPE